MNEHQMAQQLAAHEVQIRNLMDRSTRLEASHEQHERTDTENFKNQDDRIMELAITNARTVGIAAGVLGFLTLLSTAASIWAALK